MGRLVLILSQQRYNPFLREIPEDALDGQDDPAGGGENDHAEVQEMEGGDAKKGFHDAGAGNVRLVQAGLADPATNVEGVGEADQYVDGGQETRSGASGCEAPRKEGEREDGNAVGR